MGKTDTPAKPETQAARIKRLSGVVRARAPTWTLAKLRDAIKTALANSPKVADRSLVATLVRQVPKAKVVKHKPGTKGTATDPKAAAKGKGKKPARQVQAASAADVLADVGVKAKRIKQLDETISGLQVTLNSKRADRKALLDALIEETSNPDQAKLPLTAPAKGKGKGK